MITVHHCALRATDPEHRCSNLHFCATAAGSVTSLFAADRGDIEQTRILGKPRVSPPKPAGQVFVSAKATSCNSKVAAAAAAAVAIHHNHHNHRFTTPFPPRYTSGGRLRCIRLLSRSIPTPRSHLPYLPSVPLYPFSSVWGADRLSSTVPPTSSTTRATPPP